jgi:DNA-binding Xre family transcriptional regulator
MRMVSKLPALMMVKGVNKKEVSQATGLSAGTVGKIYNNEFQRIDNHTVKALCKYFELSTISDLVDIRIERKYDDDFS